MRKSDSRLLDIPIPRAYKTPISKIQLKHIRVLFQASKAHNPITHFKSCNHATHHNKPIHKYRNPLKKSNSKSPSQLHQSSSCCGIILSYWVIDLHRLSPHHQNFLIHYPHHFPNFSSPLFCVPRHHHSQAQDPSSWDYSEILKNSHSVLLIFPLQHHLLSTA
jgi:hypothetical protein